MPIDPADTLYYRQARFSTRLPKSHRFCPSHYWLLDVGGGRLRVGLTKFAIRMLGDFVEHEFTPQNGDLVSQGQPIGWIEGFKAQSDIFCVGGGVFVGGNPSLHENPQLIDKDPYDGGWLYELENATITDAVDAESYAAILDQTIQRMVDEQHQSEERQC
ncbi:Glycine cleavage system H protein [Posidoniimonas corsicana]|uniref:Glycine cleavage system H protein n=1 Tax=Posidoniimonas corsicana TaxID=1938618 RepID=A0A5C5VD49_9BACT|nr:glycine cleavage system protein H [Posidoniimonas corsicana]TWT36544.1 Glycine cleavage system H protein [Posidoniimonas corsicana]